MPVEQLPAVSLIINTLNRAAYLASTLSALKLLRYGAFEVIVVNGPSDDGTDAILAAYGDQIRIARCDTANIAASRNIGLGLAGGDIVAFIDDDAIPEPGWLDALVKPFRDPRVGAAGGFVRDRTGLHFQARVITCDRTGRLESFATAEAAGLDQHPGAPRVLALTGANIAFRRDLLLELGGFDENYRYLLDETDLNFRIMDAGYLNVVVPQAEVHHKQAPNHLRNAARIPQSLYAIARSTYYFALRHSRGHLDPALVERRLERFRRDRSRDIALLAREGHIDLPKKASLITDLAQGEADGRAAAARPPLTPLTPPTAAPMFFVPSSLSVARDRLRIGLLSQQYPPGSTGGIGNWTQTLAEGLAGEGHEISVITDAAPGDGDSVDFERGVFVHRLSHRQVVGSARLNLGPAVRHLEARSVRCFDEAMRIHALRGLDLVSGPIWDLEPFACLKRGLLPTAVSLHTTYALARPRNLEIPLASAKERAIVDGVIAAERWMLATAPFLLSNSHAIIDDLERVYKLPGLLRPRTVAVPHGVPDRRGAIRAKAPKDNRVTAVFIGRLEPRKGADALLAIAPHLLDAAPHLELVMVGEDLPIDGAGTTLRQRFLESADADIAARVTFCGNVPAEELRSWYERSDFILAPSRHEAFGLVYVEAMMHGKAVIAGRNGGSADIVLPGETGLLVDPDETEDFIDAILRLTLAPAERERMGSAGRRRYEDHFSVAAMIAGVETVFRTWIGSLKSIERPFSSSAPGAGDHIRLKPLFP
ncbi:glycosyltransferase [Chelatococcus sp. GCM10030263]|uniref:glycosyltransferase n=1 Tax=Chelatococcus sp. GCM10030263 TaxID=3273387 RepID=UPI00361DCB7A